MSVQAYLSADTVFLNASGLPTGGTILGVSPLGLLNPGKSFSGAFGASTIVNPATHPYLILMVDWGGVVDEADETNNTRAVRIQ